MKKKERRNGLDQLIELETNKREVGGLETPQIS